MVLLSDSYTSQPNCLLIIRFSMQFCMFQCFNHCDISLHICIACKITTLKGFLCLILAYVHRYKKNYLQIDMFESKVLLLRRRIHFHTYLGSNCIYGILLVNTLLIYISTIYIQIREVSVS